MPAIWDSVLQAQILHAIMRACSNTDWTKIMQLPVWIKPALMGAGAGAIALAIVGFNWGGWMTGGSAEDMSKEQSTAAVASVLMPYCIQNSKTDPKAAEILAELKEARSFKQRGIVSDAGWATPLGAERPDSALAELCQIELTKDI